MRIICGNALCIDEMQSRPVISVIIPTIGRPSLRRAVASALEQELPGAEFEVIVVNDSGHPLGGTTDALRDPRVVMVTTNRRRQSVARNVGAAIARGQYLLFLDDDDWLAPKGLAVLHDIAVKHPDFVAIYGGVEFVNERGTHLGTLNLGASGNCASHMLAAALVLLGSALIRSDAFFNVGGITTAFTTSEETELFRRLSMTGEFGNTSQIVLAALRGQGWTSSQDYGPAIAFLRTSREQILNQRGAFLRVVHSAREPYWRGRNVKAYAASTWFNVRIGQPLRAISRLIGLLLSVLAARSALFDSDFWYALRDSQVPATAQRVLSTQSFLQQARR